MPMPLRISPLLAVVIAAFLALAIGTPTVSQAQETRGRRVGNVPREVSREVVTVFNAANTKRVRGDFTMAAGDTVQGDVAVLDGRADINGLITGHLVVINGDARLNAGGRINGSLTVLGGMFEAPDRPAVSGDIRVWSARLRYHVDADTLVADLDRDLFSRWSAWQRDDPNGSQGQLFLTTAHTYNRVEGLPIYLGPRLRMRNGDTRVEMEAFGIVRTGNTYNFNADNFGHRLRLEVRQGRRGGFFAGGRVFNEVDAMEQWQLTNTEVGLASFLFTRDYRDYWQRRGALGYLGVFGPAKSTLQASFGEERWTSRFHTNAPSLFNSHVPWRKNPQADEGVVQLFTLNASVDTRNRADDPRSGWFVQAEYERGSGTLDVIAPTTTNTRTQSPGAITYGRALFDVRRYNRLAPSAQLNFRAVAGGWVNGDPLPMQRRFAVSAMDALPGFDFRQLIGSSDSGTCATGDNDVYASLGRPAQCERMVLVQAEWRGDFHFSPFGDDGYGDRRWMTGRFAADGAWVVFANSGRGWLVNEPLVSAAATSQQPRIPAIGTWRTDIGGGFDFGSFGVYVAKAISDPGIPANVYVRLGRRF